MWDQYCFSTRFVSYIDQPGPCCAFIIKRIPKQPSAKRLFVSMIDDERRPFLFKPFRLQASGRPYRLQRWAPSPSWSQLRFGQVGASQKRLQDQFWRATVATTYRRPVSICEWDAVYLSEKMQSKEGKGSSSGEGVTWFSHGLVPTAFPFHASCKDVIWKRLEKMNIALICSSARSR